MSIKSNLLDVIYFIVGVLLCIFLCVLLFLPFIGVPAAIPIIIIVIFILVIWICLLIFPLSDALSVVADFTFSNPDVAQTSPIASSDFIAASSFPAFNYTPSTPSSSLSECVDVNDTLSGSDYGDDPLSV
ncbi:hypothetical protein J8273_0106 [Carpediemonas membranifera]|uniref:Uncharacterized protein n=1 Tax=Carpediemonas membranifera TaxID=201153 RepID=A0A8J6E0C0_9EUKA|nr:hypothetical protein J8273_0106 [Carpediemonas membranifera]|eukprot:KAG9394899.1 hypothetical protein J8273_0106 [Carpediemonas membranifera]